MIEYDVENLHIKTPKTVRVSYRGRKFNIHFPEEPACYTVQWDDKIIKYFRAKGEVRLLVPEDKGTIIIKQIEEDEDLALSDWCSFYRNQTDEMMYLMSFLN